MLFLFIFAHPDDETVACAGTILQLVKAGHQVHLLSMTNGNAGEVSPVAQKSLAKYTSVGEMRAQEFHQVADYLGVHKVDILGFEDGQITNQQVWGEMTLSLIEVLQTQQPNVVVTFDHSGWYFHLDHVATSIATTLAVQQSVFQPDLFFLSHYRPDGTKWKYFYSDTIPATHVVDCTHYKDQKAKAMGYHLSQDLEIPLQHLYSAEDHFELFQLVKSTQAGEDFLQRQAIFRPTQLVSDPQIKQRLRLSSE